MVIDLLGRVHTTITLEGYGRIENSLTVDQNHPFVHGELVRRRNDAKLFGDKV